MAMPALAEWEREAENALRRVETHLAAADD
jgi:hypothetical protein